MNKAPFTFRAIKTSVKNNPTIDSNVTGLVTSPNATNVSGFSTTIPEDLNPKKAINKPIPAVIPTLSGAGIAAINNSLKDVKVSNKKMITAKKTAPNTDCLLITLVVTTVTKYEFISITSTKTIIYIVH